MSLGESGERKARFTTSRNVNVLSTHNNNNNKRSSKSLATMITGEPEEPGLKHRSTDFLARLSMRHVKSYQSKRASVTPLDMVGDQLKDAQEAAATDAAARGESASSDSGSWIAETTGGASKERRGSNFAMTELEDKEGGGVKGGKESGTKAQAGAVSGDSDGSGGSWLSDAQALSRTATGGAALEEKAV